MTVGLLRSGDWPAVRHIGRCAAPPANQRCAVGLMPLPREEFRQLHLRKAEHSSFLKKYHIHHQIRKGSLERGRFMRLVGYELAI